MEVLLMYCRFSELDFKTEEYKNLAYYLLKDIRDLQFSLIYDEEYAEYMESNVGKNVSKVLHFYNDTNRRMLLGLKLTFYYYTGKLSDLVLLDDEEESVDIFSPLS
jgi:hypothetical protein